MKKKKLSMYAFGGNQLDDETNPKKVKTAPAGYVIDKDYTDKANPNRVYYKKVGAAATTVAPTIVAAHNAPNVFRRRGTSAATSVVPINRTPTANTTIDRVYTEPDTVIPTPKTAWRGTQILTTTPGGSNKALGELEYPIRNSANVGDGGMINNTTNQNYKFQYYKPGTADVDGNIINISSDDWNTRGQTTNYADSSFINNVARNGKFIPKMAMGGIGVADDSPDLSDLSDDELEQLQQYADENGMTPEEAYQDIQMQNQDQGQSQEEGESPLVDVMGDSDEDDQGYAYGGSFKLNPKHKGWCSPMTKSTCVGKRRQFAINAKNHFKKHAMGGAAINVEGGEALETPNGQISKVRGPSHEAGGVDVKVPVGTKIFSDRLAIDGKTMQERKMNREARLSKLAKLIKTNPTNALTKNTVARTSDIIDAEDQKDMMLQKVANKMYSPPQQQGDGDGDKGGYAYGGRTRSYAVGGQSQDPLLQFLGEASDNPWQIDGSTDARIPYRNNYMDSIPNMPSNGMDSAGGVSGYTKPTYPASAPTSVSTGEGLTLGDKIGIGTSILGAGLQFLNTRANARATRPVKNRYIGFGNDALNSNQSAIDYVAGNKTNEDIDIQTQSNSSYKRNANSASDVNVLRALDSSSDMGRRKALNASTDTANRAMGSLLGQRGQLQNQRDQYVDYGATAADNANAQNLDNYYSNMASNIAGATTTGESIGRNLNISKSNQDDEDLIGLLSKNGIKLGRDKNGKRILVNS